MLDRNVTEAPPGLSGRSSLQVAPAPSAFNKLRRLVWGVVEATAYRWSPVPFHGFRRMLLRLFGAKIGPRAHPYPDARIWAPWNLVMERGSCLGPRAICYSASLVHLRENCIVSQGAHLCGATHDHGDPSFTLMVGPIVIEVDAWVAADAFVGPGVTIGTRAVVGARAVAVKDIPAGVIVAGNPAKLIAYR